MTRMISYAQNFEDVILNRVFRGKREGFYVDVGAMDPVRGSVTKHFYDLGWRGVNVEPVPRFFKALARGRPRDVNLPVAIGKSRDTLELYDFRLAGVSTFSPEFADHFVEQGYSYTKRPIEVLTLKDVCEEHCRGPVDFMKIDVEGWEKEVLEGGGDWQRFRPRVLIIEATEPESNEPLWDEWEPFLLERGYVFAYFDGLNRFYVPKEAIGLLEHFRLPPNVMDDFETYEMYRLKIIPRIVLSFLKGVRSLCGGGTGRVARRGNGKDGGPSVREPEKEPARLYEPVMETSQPYEPEKETVDAAALLRRVENVVRNRWLSESRVPPPQTIWMGKEDEFQPQDMFPWRSVPFLPAGGKSRIWFLPYFSRLSEKGEMFGSRIYDRLSHGAESRLSSMNPLFLAGLGVVSVVYKSLFSQMTARLKRSVWIRSWVVRVLARFQRKD